MLSISFIMTLLLFIMTSGKSGSAGLLVFEYVVGIDAGWNNTFVFSKTRGSSGGARDHAPRIWELNG